MQCSGNSWPLHSPWPGFYKVNQTRATSATWPGTDLPGGAGCSLLFEKHRAEEQGTGRPHGVPGHSSGQNCNDCRVFLLELLEGGWAVPQPRLCQSTTQRNKPPRGASGDVGCSFPPGCRFSSEKPLGTPWQAQVTCPPR